MESLTPLIPDLSIIIVSWNVRDLLRECLQSIRDQAGTLSIEVIVVDSASADESVAMIRESFPEVILQAETENVGYTRGNNIGLAMATGRHLYLLNPDTVILDDSMQQMVAYLDAHPEVGMVGPQTLNTDGTHQSSRRRFPTKALAFFESTWLEPLAPKRMLERFTVREIADDATAEVDWVQGSALMLRRDVYAQIGGMDTGFIMFSEEVDLCKRAHDAGWKTVYLGTARIIHHGGKSTAQVSAKKHIYFQESKLRYFRKHHGAGITFVLRFFLLLNYAIQLVLEGVKLLLGSKRAMRQERVQTYWQVLRSGLKVRG